MIVLSPKEWAMNLHRLTQVIAYDANLSEMVTGHRREGNSNHHYKAALEESFTDNASHTWAKPTIIIVMPQFSCIRRGGEQKNMQLN
jgi:hypothetical protein